MAWIMFYRLANYWSNCDDTPNGIFPPIKIRWTSRMIFKSILMSIAEKTEQQWWEVPIDFFDAKQTETETIPTRDLAQFKLKLCIFLFQYEFQN